MPLCHKPEPGPRPRLPALRRRPLRPSSCSRRPPPAVVVAALVGLGDSRPAGRPARPDGRSARGPKRAAIGHQDPVTESWGRPRKEGVRTAVVSLSPSCHPAHGVAGLAGWRSMIPLEALQRWRRCCVDRREPARTPAPPAPGRARLAGSGTRPAHGPSRGAWRRTRPGSCSSTLRPSSHASRRPSPPPPKAPAQGSAARCVADAPSTPSRRNSFHPNRLPGSSEAAAPQM